MAYTHAPQERPTAFVPSRLRGHLGGSGETTRGSRSSLLQVPAEVDLHAYDPVLVVERDDLGVPSPRASGGGGLVGDDHLVARLDEPDKIETVSTPRPGPAPLEVAIAVELRVRGR